MAKRRSTRPRTGAPELASWKQAHATWLSPRHGHRYRVDKSHSPSKRKTVRPPRKAVLNSPVPSIVTEYGPSIVSDIFRPGSPAHSSIYPSPFTQNSLKTYHLTANSLVPLNTAADIKPYTLALALLPSPRSISLSGTSLSIWASYALASTLHALPTLEHLDISDTFTGRTTTEIAPALDALVSAILELPRLHTLTLSHNAFGPDVQAPLIRLLARHTPLVALHMDNVGLGPQTGVAIAEALSALAQRKRECSAPALRVLSLDRNHLVEDEERPEVGMAEWARALAAHGGLRVVSLRNNGLRKAGLEVLVREGLGLLSELRVLDLEDNTFASRGEVSAVLAEAVGGWPVLAELNVNDSLLGSRGAELLIEALGRSGGSVLEVLRLRGNNLSSGNVRALAEAVERLPKLRVVEVGENNFGAEDGGYSLLRESVERRGRREGWECSVDEIGDEQASESSSPGAG